jgi:4'-phosphopantetheinyl transferase
MTAQAVGLPILVCDVWFADVELERPAHRALLDPAETARRVAFQRDADKALFTLGAALLRLIGARETGATPEALRVDRSCRQCGGPHGKPSIVGVDLHVSVSHSGGKVALAVTRAAPIGVDIEVVGEHDIEELARLVLTPDEKVSRVEDFFTYWCRKESVIKATGDGLRVPLKQVVVSPVDQRAALVSYRGAPLATSMRDLRIEPGYAAALTLLARGDLEMHTHDAARLLS